MRADRKGAEQRDCRPCRCGFGVVGCVCLASLTSGERQGADRTDRDAETFSGAVRGPSGTGFREAQRSGEREKGEEHLHGAGCSFWEEGSPGSDHRERDSRDPGGGQPAARQDDRQRDAGQLRDGPR